MRLHFLLTTSILIPLYILHFLLTVFILISLYIADISLWRAIFCSMAVAAAACLLLKVGLIWLTEHPVGHPYVADILALLVFIGLAVIILII